MGGASKKRMTVRVETDPDESDNNDDFTEELTAEAIQKLTAST
jgi:hypothetical protein